MREDIDLKVEAYKVDKSPSGTSSSRDIAPSGSTSLRQTVDRRIPAGTFVVKTAQPLGDLAVYLLEPQSEDGLATWNFFDNGLEPGSEFPVLRVLSLPALLTTKVKPLPEDRTSNKPITYDMLMGKATPPNFSGSPTPIIRFLDDGEHFLQYKDGRSYKVHAISGKAEPYETTIRPPAVAPGSLRRPAAQVESSLEENDGDLYLNKHDGSPAVRLTKSPEKKKELTSLSPGGKYAAYVHAGNLYLVDIGHADRKAANERRLSRHL